MKVIEYGLEELFRKADNTVDKVAQNRFPDHYAVWARFHDAHDEIKEAGKVLLLSYRLERNKGLLI